MPFTGTVVTPTRAAPDHKRPSPTRRQKPALSRRGSHTLEANASRAGWSEGPVAACPSACPPHSGQAPQSQPWVSLPTGPWPGLSLADPQQPCQPHHSSVLSAPEGPGSHSPPPGRALARSQAQGGRPRALRLTACGWVQRGGSQCRRAAGAPGPPDEGQSTDRRWARTEGHFMSRGAQVGGSAWPAGGGGGPRVSAE